MVHPACLIPEETFCTCVIRKVSLNLRKKYVVSSYLTRAGLSSFSFLPSSPSSSVCPQGTDFTCSVWDPSVSCLCGSPASNLYLLVTLWAAVCDKCLCERLSQFRCDVNQISYDYTVEGTRSDRQSAWWTMDGGSWYCIGNRDQDHPQEKEKQKSKMDVWGGFTNSCEKKRSQKQRRKDIRMQSSKE